MVELIPRQVLFGNPERVSPRISPDGTRLAWIAPHEDVLNVWVAPISAEHGVDWPAASVVTDDSDRGIRMFAWAHDGRHLLYLQDTGGDENWRLHDVDLQTMQRRDLTPFDGVQTQLIAMERKFPTELLIGLNRDNAQLHDVYRLDLVTGELVKESRTSASSAGRRTRSWWSGRPPRRSPMAATSLLVRDDADSDWRPLLTVASDDALTSAPIAFSEDGRSLLATSSVGARPAGWSGSTLPPARPRCWRRTRRPTSQGVRLQPDTREPQIVTLLKDRSEYLVLDPAVAADLEAIRALHPGDPHASRTPTMPTRPGWSASPTTRARCLLQLRPGQPHRPFPLRGPARSCPATSWPRWSRSASPPGTASPSTATRPSRPAPTARPADRAQRARRPLGPRRLGLQPRGPVAGQPRLPLRPGQLPGIDRLRQDRSSMPVTANGAAGCMTTWSTPCLCGRAGLRRPGARGHLRRLLRWLRGAGRGGVHARGLFCCAVDIVGPSNLIDPDRDDPAVLGADDRAVPPRVGDPDGRRRFPLVALAAVPGRATSASRCSSPRAPMTRG